ncbi:HDIG domain-containing metalloprotein [Acetanaerobacterium elongatum]|uniref:HDIG domain-containing protein n=1 Tax=Acetanaerobacterium elongatum TaxID=258515 RepID=A0A1G9ZAS9_9FIRM|nr:HDIG domain-containing metalloprotein [Acetanaerobacterium elongatum]SDN18520.1 HDIG domain-containing protein [Acetanaerobacterium elongatum]
MKADIALFNELERHLMQDERPSEYLNNLACKPEFTGYPFTMLQKQIATKQSPKHHPEGSVWNHTLLVVDEAAKVKRLSSNPRVFMWAALLHDIGKPSTTKVRDGKITSYDHDLIGMNLARNFLSAFSLDKVMVDAVCGLVRYHMQILFVVNGMRFADIKGMLEHTDVNEVALLGLCDRLGRLNYNRELEEENIRQFLIKSGVGLNDERWGFLR